MFDKCHVSAAFNQTSKGSSMTKVIGSQLISSPPFLPLSIGVLHDCCMFDKCHVSAAFNQTSKCSSMTKVIFHMISPTKMSSRPVTKVTHVTVFPIIWFVSILIFSTPCSRSTSFVEIFGCGSKRMTSLITDSLIGQEPGHWHYPTGAMANSWMASSPPLHIYYFRMFV